MKIIRTGYLLIMFTGFCQMVMAQNNPPYFFRMVMEKDGVETELNITNLETLNLKEGETAAIKLYANDPDGDAAHISASGVQSSWMYFICPSGASSATLLLLPEDDANGDHTIVFETFDDTPSYAGATLSLPLHIIDRNALTDNDTEITVACYPNPVIDVAMVEFVIPQDGHFTVKIYSLSGREVMTVYDASKVAARYFEKVDMSGLGPGTYVIRVTLDGVGSKSCRIIKL